ncbi:hypothetical protein FCJ61_04880 [Burkholderia metallica]|uniref:hypothetical protein n=1 Tax=Burkholderia metallica TaxID=488729 RepID=UPI00157B850B|nr:hypothetical protein [Burkholderia metallica]NTZ82368.1 hypothetical protein [Burkholderia metallica]
MKHQNLENLRQTLGEALTNALAELIDVEAFDMHDSRNVDLILDKLMPAVTAVHPTLTGSVKPVAAPGGHCERAGGCVCGGDLPRVREGCSEWVKSESAPAPTVERANCTVRGTPEQIETERKLTCEAIDGAFWFGYHGNNAPPSRDHWLTQYWDFGRKLAGFDKVRAALVGLVGSDNKDELEQMAAVMGAFASGGDQAAVLSAIRALQATSER